MRRFVVVPVATEQTQRGPSRSPKYAGREGLTGVRGQVIDVADLLRIPADEVYACWVSGDEATVEELAGEPDVIDVTPVRDEVVAALNQRYDRDTDLQGWLDSFDI